MLLPGRMAGSRQGTGLHLGCLLVSERAQPVPQVGTTGREDGDGHSPALVAPADPMATVATGTPAGIWTIERSESRPCRGLALDRDANDRQRPVCEATMPGR